MITFPVTQKKADALRSRMKQCGLQEADFEEKFIRSSGPGGQKTNKTASCVYLIHKPTGTEVKCDKERSQGLNRYYARKFMCEQIESKTEGVKSKQQFKAEKIRKQKKRRKRRAADKLKRKD
ncbi:Peptide chain release factor 1 [Sedimentisphaera cyanobacteriorum]|uniref:Peptide chain release factor 1 n=2 Tax=Sedimentisphaera cyanobacteriorum TaxID=1940790 RepID=A0A1Q2HN12_9BACT|nr:Peptide chain release factor 1 [Sedimentisphaera cyanobacteriorum]